MLVIIDDIDRYAGASPAPVKNTGASSLRGEALFILAAVTEVAPPGSARFIGAASLARIEAAHLLDQAANLPADHAFDRIKPIVKRFPIADLLVTFFVA
jgi:hypothetical protein